MTSETSRTMPRRHRPLYRDTSDKMIAGVCSGLGHYFDIHTTLVRVAFVVFTLLGGAGLLAYVVLWFALDPAPNSYYLEDQTEPDIEQAQTEPEALPKGQSDGVPDDVDNVSTETTAEERVEEPEITEP